MKIFKYIPISLFVLNNAMFDLYAPVKSTHWSIIFFSLMYLSIILWSIKDIFVVTLYERCFFMVMIVGFLTKIIIEVSKWNFPYEEYYLSISQIETTLPVLCLIVSGLTALIIFLWKR